jgi:serine/alanine adding enzyme
MEPYEIVNNIDLHNISQSPVKNFADKDDVYYSPAYGKLYEDIENGEYIRYKLSTHAGTVINPFIKRPIPWLIDGKQYYDIITPYGYGGPLLVDCDCAEPLMQEFNTAFSLFCKDNDIICEFIRFHPLINNAAYCNSVYDVVLNRHTVAMDIADAAFFSTQFDTPCRNRVRKSSKNGVIIEIDNQLKAIDVFADLYYMTMAKNGADDYYFFSRSYFHKIRDELAGSASLINARYNDKIIASSLFLFTAGGNAHYHFSATNPEYYSLASNNLILKTACDYFSGLGCTWLHIGGGLSSDMNDRLFVFKRTFGREDRNLKDFYTGKRVWNKEVYDRAVDIYMANGGCRNSFFPEYRFHL